MSSMRLFSALLACCLPLSLAAGVPPAKWTGLQGKAAAQGEVRLIVQLDTAFTPVGRLPAAAKAQQDQIIEQAQSALASLLTGSGTREIARFRHIPFMVIAADSPGVQMLAGLPQVIGIGEDIPEPPELASSAPVIGADSTWASGYSGTGQVVAVLDTGVDPAHPFFTTGSKVVDEGCYSSNVAEDITSMCPGGASSSTDPGSGANCPLAVRGCNHGTHVAGIAVGDDGVGPNIGIARGAKLIPIMVFTRFDSASSCQGLAPCALSYPSDQTLGLERVLDLSASHDIAAVNMSLGGGSFADSASCDLANVMRKMAIDNLRSVGIATVVSSGNSGYKSAIGQPACISTAISVGATTDDDSIPNFSNVADFLDLLAPGYDITSAAAGGGTVSFSGTSMSAPHVAAAWAVLRQANPAATIEEILAALQTTGTPVDDLRPGGTVTGIPRINLDLALYALGALQPEFDSSPAADSTIPFGDVALNVSSPDELIAVSNTGDGDLTLSCALSGIDAGSFGVSTCPASIAPLGSMDVGVHCTPLSGGLLAANLDLTTNDLDEPLVSFSLSCTGLGPEFNSDPVANSSFDFGDIELGGSSAGQILQVSNSGTETLTLGCAKSGDAPGMFDVTCAPPVAPGGSEDITINCNPSIIGNLSALLDLTTNDADEGSVSYGLACRGVAVEFEADPVAGSILDFGSVDVDTVSPPLDVLVDNAGNLPLTLGCALSGPNAAWFGIIQCPDTVAPAGNVDVQVECAPDNPGTRTASLDFTTNDPDEGGVSYTLKCYGYEEAYLSDSFEGNDPP